MTDIRELDPDTVDRIAAGEVVERPASAVKELVENAVDAGASRVDVAVERGGTERIRVADDGEGMTAEAARLAVEKHTTSKIRDLDDLESGVATLGFRGEALHAIAAVSRLTLRTRARGEARGTELVVEGGEVVSSGPVGCPEGTEVEVAELFFNVPARRKYLKRDATEFSHVSDVVSGYALANPDVAVALEHDGRETFATTGRGDRREAVMAVYGREIAANMVPVAGEDLPEGPLSAVSGLVSHPETNRASRDYLDVFVNGRYVTASAVREAVVDAYDTQLAPDRYPFAALSLAVDAAAVDVNVHPRKLEVRFADEDGARRQVRAAVRDALLDAGLVRSSAPRGRSAPEQADIAPESGTDADSGTDAEFGTDAESRSDGRASGDDGADASAFDTKATDTSTSDAGATDASAPNSGGADAARPGPDERVGTSGGRSRPAAADAGDAPADDSDAGAGRRRRQAGRRFRADLTQTTLDGATADERRTFERLPAMRVLGQLDDTYVVAETDDGLVLVDQHAADERVHYERLRARFAGDVTTQALAEPVDLELTAAEAETLAARGEALARLGFRARLADDRTARVSTVPALLADADAPALVRDLLGALAGGDADETVESAADRLLGDMACHPAVTGNESLTEGSVVALLRALDDCENPYACPHGRPVVVEFSADEIAARFERDYPGHGGRRRPE